MRLVCIQNATESTAAAANGSNRITSKCPQLTSTDALTCLDDLN
jgi:hypothetical protein